ADGRRRRRADACSRPQPFRLQYRKRTRCVDRRPRYRCRVWMDVDRMGRYIVCARRPRSVRNVAPDRRHVAKTLTRLCCRACSMTTSLAARRRPDGEPTRPNFGRRIRTPFVRAILQSNGGLTALSSAERKVRQRAPDLAFKSSSQARENKCWARPSTAHLSTHATARGTLRRADEVIE